MRQVVTSPSLALLALVVACQGAAAPEVLPQLLTPDTVVTAARRAAGKPVETAAR